MFNNWFNRSIKVINFKCSGFNLMFLLTIRLVLTGSAIAAVFLLVLLAISCCTGLHWFHCFAGVVAKSVAFLVVSLLVLMAISGCTGFYWFAGVVAVSVAVLFLDFHLFCLQYQVILVWTGSTFLLVLVLRL